MASRLTRKLGWFLAFSVLGAFAYITIAPRIAYRLEQSSVDLSVLDAWYHRLSLDSVGGVSVSSDAVSVSGYWLGWFDLDARRRVLGSVVTPLRPIARQGLSNVRDEWQLREVSAQRYLVHRPSGATIKIAPPGYGLPRELDATRLSSDRHVVAIASGDWKAGPSSYVGVLVVQGAQLAPR